MAKRWTREEEAELILRRAKCESYEQIGAVLGRTPEAIKSKAVDMRLTDKKTVKAPKAWTPAEDAALADLIRSGATVPQIAKRLNHGESSVYQRIKVLGIKTPTAAKLERPEQMTMTYEAPELTKGVPDVVEALRMAVDDLMKQFGALAANVDSTGRLAVETEKKLSGLNVRVAKAHALAQSATAWQRKSPIYRMTHRAPVVELKKEGE